MPDSPDGIDEETEPEAFSKKISWQGKEIFEKLICCNIKQ